MCGSHPATARFDRPDAAAASEVAAVLCSCCGDCDFEERYPSSLLLCVSGSGFMSRAANVKMTALHTMT